MPSVTFNGVEFLFTTPQYNPSLAAAIRTIPGASWSSRDEVWRAPASSAEQAYRISRRFSLRSTARASRMFADMTVAGSLKVTLAGDGATVFTPRTWGSADDVRKALVRIPGAEAHDDRVEVPPESMPALRNVALAYGFEVPGEPEQRPKARRTFKLPRTLAEILHPYQRDGALFAAQRMRALIADETGLGKSAQAIAWLLMIGLASVEGFQAMVLCPASLVLNWRDELETWAPGVSYSLLRGKAHDGPGGPDYSGRVLVASYDSLERHTEALGALGLRAMVADEAHFLKSPRTKRSKLVRQLASGVEYRVLMTATPSPNRPSELYPLIEILGREGEFGSWHDFATRYCDAHKTGWGWDTSGHSNLDELNERLSSFMIARPMDEVLPQIPKVLRQIVPLEIVNRAEYDTAESETALYLLRSAMVARDRAGAAPSADVSEIVRKLSRRNTLARLSVLREVASRGKLPAAIQWVTDHVESIDPTEKVVVMAWYQSTQKRMYEALSGEKGPGVGVLRLAEDQSPDERMQVIRDFTLDPEARVLVASIGVAGVGLNLQAANHLVLVDPVWSAAQVLQAQGRLRRIGQTRPIVVYGLVGDATIDVSIMRAINEKLKVSSQVIGGEDDDTGLEAAVGMLTERAERELVQRGPERLEEGDLVYVGGHVGKVLSVNGASAKVSKGGKPETFPIGDLYLISPKDRLRSRKEGVETYKRLADKYGADKVREAAKLYGLADSTDLVRYLGSIEAIEGIITGSVPD